MSRNIPFQPPPLDTNFSDSNPAGVSPCERDRLSLLSACRRSPFCPRADVSAAVADMCAPADDMTAMTAEAAEQFLLITGVVTLCIALYVSLCLVERACAIVFPKRKKKSP